MPAAGRQSGLGPDSAEPESGRPAGGSPPRLAREQVPIHSSKPRYLLSRSGTVSHWHGLSLGVRVAANLNARASATVQRTPGGRAPARAAAFVSLSVIPSLRLSVGATVPFTGKLNDFKLNDFKLIIE